MEKNITTRSSGAIIIKGGRIVAPGSPYNKKTADILIKNGKIVEIGKINEKADNEVDARNCVITTGLFDLRCRQGEPGNEQNEDLNSILNAACAGGFTGICTLPDLSYTVQSIDQIEYHQHLT